MNNAQYIFRFFATPWAPLIVAAVGAIAIYLLMPDGRTGRARRGSLAGLLGALAVAGLVVWIATLQIQRTYAAPLQDAPALRLYFYLFMAIAIFAAAKAVSHQMPIYCVLYFVIVVLALAAVLLLTLATFLAVGLILIFAGAVLVLFVFVVMLAQHAAGSRLGERDARPRTPVAGLAVSLLLVCAIGWAIRSLTVQPGAMNELAMRQAGQTPPGGPADFGIELFTHNLLALELAGVLLLMAIVGSVALVRRRIMETSAGGDKDQRKSIV